MSEDIINQTASWQPDVACSQCTGCQKNFSVFNRRHHCRCCGNIFCHNCSNKFVSYNIQKLRPVKRPDIEEDFPPYRTCHRCYDNLYSLGLLYNQRNLHNISADRNNDDSPADGIASETANGSPIDITKNNSTIRERRTQNTTTVINEDVDSERNHCPICNVAFETLGEEVSEVLVEQHIQNCITQAERAQQHLESPDFQNGEPLSSPISKNRMLVYKVPLPKDAKAEINEDDYEECPICFEAMLPGEKIGRLECLCVFHYHCIKSWFIKKSNKVAITEGITHIGKNFCPLHDAIV